MLCKINNFQCLKYQFSPLNKQISRFFINPDQQQQHRFYIVHNKVQFPFLATRVNNKRRQLDSYKNMSQDFKYLYGQDGLNNIISMYESYSTDQQSSVITENQVMEKGQQFVQWVNDLITSKIRIINQISSRSVQIFQHILKEQIQIQARILQLQHQCGQKGATIQNHLYTIKNIQSKLSQGQNDIYKLRLQNTQLAEKIQKQEYRFKREAKQFRKTFRIVQEETQTQKQIHDSIKLDYEYYKQQNQIIIEQLKTVKQDRNVLKKQFQQTKRLLHASQSKVEWEIKKKLPLEETIKQQKQLIQKLLHQIQDFKQTFKNDDKDDDYEDISEGNLDEKDSEYLSHPTQSFDINILSDQIALRQSFSSEFDMEQLVRKNSLRKSFDEQPSENNFNYLTNQYGNTLTVKKSQFSKQHHSNHNNNVIDLTSNNQRSPRQSPLNLNKKDAEKSTNRILIKDIQRSQVSSQYVDSQVKMRSFTNSPEIRHFQTKDTINEKQEDSDIVGQRIQTQPSSFQSFRTVVPDLYFAHFLLTSQAVKIKEDCQVMLNIDMKQYYQEIIAKRIPMHIWDDWIRNKLRETVKQIQKKHKLPK